MLAIFVGQNKSEQNLPMAMKNFLQTSKVKMRGMNLTRKCPNAYCPVAGGRQVPLQESGLISLPWNCPADCQYSQESQARWMQAESTQDILTRLANASTDEDVNAIFADLFGTKGCSCGSCTCSKSQCD